MTRTLLTALFAAFIALPAQAQSPDPVCTPDRSMAVVLETQHGEIVIEEHRQENPYGVFIWQLWANPETNTWSLTAYLEGHPAMCMFRAGEDYHGITLDMLLAGEAV